MILELTLGTLGAASAAWALSERAAHGRAKEELRLGLASAEAQLRAAQTQSEARMHAVQGQAELRVRAAQDNAQQAMAQAQASVQAAQELAQLRLAEAQRKWEEMSARAERAESLSAGQRVALQSLRAERDRLALELEDVRQAQVSYGDAERARAALATQLEQAEQELNRLRSERGRDSSRTFFARMQELDKEVSTQRVELERWVHRAQAAEAELERRDQHPETHPLVAERDALRARVEALEDSLRRVASIRAALRVLGLPSPSRDAQFFSPERRERTESVLRDTYIAAQAAGAGIFDERGGAWARFGNPVVVERLAAAVALLRVAPVEAALGAPPQLVSELYGVYGRHLIELPGTSHCLAATGSREVPALALRLAALQLVGLNTAPRAELLPSAMDLDPERSDRLGAWATRRGALSAAVFGAGEPAATDSAFAGACAPLVTAVQALYHRSARDGFDQGYALIWRADDDISLAARVLDGGQTVAFARFNAPPAPRVLDDLLATVRWLGLAAAS